MNLNSRTTASILERYSHSVFISKNSIICRKLLESNKTIKGLHIHTKNKELLYTFKMFYKNVNVV